MADFNFVNRNGTLHFKDPDTEELIPVDLADVDADSLNTDELNSARFIVPSDSHADIETKLASSGVVVWTPGDYSTLPDRVEIGASDLSIHIQSGAHIAVDDAATPTMIPANNRDAEWLAVLFNDGYDNVEIHNHGLIEGRRWDDGETKATVVRPYTICIGIWNASGCHIENYNSDLYNASTGIFVVDSTDITAENLYSSAKREAVLSWEGCTDCHVGTARGVDGNEVINCNAYNEDCSVERIVGDGAANNDLAGIEIEESSRITVDSIEVFNGCSRAALINGTKKTGTDANPDVTDPKFTAKTRLAEANDVTIRSVRGTTESVGITVQNGDNPHPVQNCTIRDAYLVCTAGRGLEVLANGDGQLDGFTAEGYFETQATGTRGAYLTGGGTWQASDFDLDIHCVAVDANAVELNNVDGVTGHIRAESPSGRGVLIYCNPGYSCSEYDLHVVSKNNGGRGLHINGGGTVENNRIVGTCVGNAGNDIDLGAGTDMELDIRHDSYFQNDDATTRIVVNGVGKNAGDPNTTGEWTGNGREGVVVVDTTNGIVYHYRGGGWV